MRTAGTAAAVVLALCFAHPLAAVSNRGRGSDRPRRGEDLAVHPGERLLVVAPHPDDETLGSGALIQRVVREGGSVTVVLVTAGDALVSGVVKEAGRPHPGPAAFVAYGERRVREARRAVRALAGARGRVALLGFPDGGLDRLLRAAGDARHPLASATTRAGDPPYRDAVEPDLPYTGANLRRALKELIAEERPSIIALADPFDRHPDHAAAGIFTLAAVHDWLREQKGDEQPRLLSFLVHWPGWPPGWDGGTEGSMYDPLPLPADFPRREIATLWLSPPEIGGKRRALAEHRTQQREMAGFLEAFVRGTEVFGLLGRRDTDEAARRLGR